MSKHTSGPWGAFSGKRVVSGATEFFVQPLEVEREFGGIVAVVPIDTYDKSTQLANAKLLAAAPELLEALRVMVDVFQPTSEPSAQGHVENEAHGLAVAALAKARGES